MPIRRRLDINKPPLTPRLSEEDVRRIVNEELDRRFPGSTHADPSSASSVVTTNVVREFRLWHVNQSETFQAGVQLCFGGARFLLLEELRIRRNQNSFSIYQDSPHNAVRARQVGRALSISTNLEVHIIAADTIVATINAPAGSRRAAAPSRETELGLGAMMERALERAGIPASNQIAGIDDVEAELGINDEIVRQDDDIAPMRYAVVPYTLNSEEETFIDNAIDENVRENGTIPQFWRTVLHGLAREDMVPMSTEGLNGRDGVVLPRTLTISEADLLRRALTTERAQRNMRGAAVTTELMQDVWNGFIERLMRARENSHRNRR